MHITTVVNRKGGVGKTTLVRNLAYLLAADYGKRVLMIDLDSSGNLSEFFGAEAPETNEYYGVAELLVNPDADPREMIHHTTQPNLDILPGNSTIAKAEMEVKLDVMLPQQYRLAEHLQKIQDDYDFCLIDSPPTVDAAITVINALSCSNDVIIPCTPNANAIKGVDTITSMVKTVQRYNKALSIRGVVLCRIGYKKLDKELLEAHLSIPRFKTYIRESSATAEYSEVAHLSFRDYSRKAPVCLDMDNLTAEYLGVAFPHPEQFDAHPEDDDDDYL